MKEKFSALYAKEGTKKVISSLISILAGLLVGGIVVIVVGAFNSKISGSGIWDGIRLIFVTLGANGVFYRFGDKTGHVAGVPCKVGDTNGAGDTFFGAALSKLCKEELDTLTVDKLESILAFANKAASITTSRHGAIPAMPTLAEVEG